MGIKRWEQSIQEIQYLYPRDAPETSSGHGTLLLGAGRHSELHVRKFIFWPECGSWVEGDRVGSLLVVIVVGDDTESNALNRFSELVWELRELAEGNRGCEDEFVVCPEDSGANAIVSLAHGEEPYRNLIPFLAFALLLSTEILHLRLAQGVDNKAIGRQGIFHNFQLDLEREKGPITG